jgi:hypothetical protein
LARLASSSRKTASIGVPGLRRGRRGDASSATTRPWSVMSTLWAAAAARTSSSRLLFMVLMSTRCMRIEFDSGSGDLELRQILRKSGFACSR